jgi:hypothetical protein
MQAWTDTFLKLLRLLPPPLLPVPSQLHPRRWSLYSQAAILTATVTTPTPPSCKRGAFLYHSPCPRTMNTFLPYIALCDATVSKPFRPKKRICPSHATVRRTLDVSQRDKWGSGACTANTVQPPKSKREPSAFPRASRTFIIPSRLGRDGIPLFVETSQRGSRQT